MNGRINITKSIMNLIIKFPKKLFSQTSRVKRFLPVKNLRELEEKKEKLEKNRYYDGMDFKNQNEIDVKKREIFYPVQHPKLLNNPSSSVVNYKPPAKNLTEYYRVPGEIAEFEPPEFESPIDARELDIGVLGPPNAGKSSLVNKIIGMEISAVSSKYGTTYDQIEGVYTDPNEKIQLVLYDTPGAIKLNRSIKSKKIMTKAWGVLTDCDKVLFVIDSVKHLDIITKEAVKRLLNRKFKPSLLKLLNKIKSLNEDEVSIENILKMQQELNKADVDSLDYEAKNISSVLVMNKVDLVTNKRKLKALQEELEDLGAFDKVFHVSCETGYGLDNLLSYLKSEAQRRPWKYHPEIKSTQSDQEKCEEVLKGIIFNRFYKEIPYDTLPRMTAWVPFNNGEIKVNFDIEVRYQVQMAMMVGEKGRVLNEIKAELDKALTKLYQMPVKSYLKVIKRRSTYRDRVETLNEHSSLAF